MLRPDAGGQVKRVGHPVDVSSNVLAVGPSLQPHSNKADGVANAARRHEDACAVAKSNFQRAQSQSLANLTVTALMLGARHRVGRLGQAPEIFLNPTQPASE